VTGAVIARLTVAYVGTRYAGWQRQPDAPTVQAAVEEALGRLLGEPVDVVGAGRTDAGVHARGQVASTRIGREFPLDGLVHGANHHLPADVRVLAAARAPDDFHARRSALAKLYVYRLHLGRLPPPERAPLVAAAPRRLALEPLEDAARALVGEHDFEAFALSGRAPGPTRRRIFTAAWQRDGDELTFRIVGEGFLRGMVRSLVGTMLEVGRGARSLSDFAALLDTPGVGRAGHAGLAGPTAPARGLTLERVDYPAAAIAAGDPEAAGTSLDALAGAGDARSLE
jgi:tRNA pseudouridine38-40 synthase